MREKKALAIYDWWCPWCQQGFYSSQVDDICPECEYPLCPLCGFHLHGDPSAPACGKLDFEEGGK